MRNKGEEKLKYEKEKIDELISVREKGFRRIQNENTILITECNKLRKNLNEIYVNVIDIELRFEQLTKINPKLSKNDIVKQIKEFIKITHEKIKQNYQNQKLSKLAKLQKMEKTANNFRRIANPVDIVKVIAFLASEKSKNITGQIIKVDGGRIYLFRLIVIII